MTVKPKQSILEITPYKGGLSKSKNRDSVIKLSSNENIFGAPPEAVEAYKNSSDKLHLYPDGSALKLRQEIGRVYDLNYENIVCGAGSDEIISLLCQAYAGNGDEVIYTQHGFLMYKISTLAVGATPVVANETDLRTDIEEILKCVTDKTKIVFVANPNNPTGSYVSHQELVHLRKSLRNDILLVIDAAYAEYVDEADYIAGSEIVDLGTNTVMTRTFSKIYGLAALRIGWAYCPFEIADILNRVRGPFNVSTAAIEAATAALGNQEFVKKVQQHNKHEIKLMSDQLSALGLEVCPTVGNFILIEFPKGHKGAQAAFDYLMDAGIIVRQVVNYGLPDYLRITIGTKEQNQLVLEALTGFIKDVDMLFN